MSKANLPINIQEQMAKEVQSIASRIAAPSGDRIKINGGRGFTLPDGSSGEELQVVVIDFLSTNLYYDRPFNRDKPVPPACFAIGEEPSLLAPSPNSPARQADSCSVCPLNQFGTALTGSGKACKNTRLLAVVPVTDLEKPAEEANILILSVPPTSLKEFDGYVSKLASRFKTIPLGAITKITTDMSVDYAAPRFDIISKLDEMSLVKAFGLKEEARKRLEAEPDVKDYEAPKTRGR